jgi:hypothetical protein
MQYVTVAWQRAAEKATPTLGQRKKSPTQISFHIFSKNRAGGQIFAENLS